MLSAVVSRLKRKASSTTGRSSVAKKFAFSARASRVSVGNTSKTTSTPPATMGATGGRRRDEVTR